VINTDGVKVPFEAVTITNKSLKQSTGQIWLAIKVLPTSNVVWLDACLKKYVGAPLKQDKPPSSAPTRPAATPWDIPSHSLILLWYLFRLLFVCFFFVQRLHRAPTVVPWRPDRGPFRAVGANKVSRAPQ